MSKNLDTLPKRPRQVHPQCKKPKPISSITSKPPWPYVQKAWDLTKQIKIGPSPIQKTQAHAKRHACVPSQRV
jgi:hypothetical protein